MRLSFGLATLLTLAASLPAQANWFDSLLPARTVGWQQTRVISGPAAPISWGGSKGEVIVEHGHGCGFEHGCGFKTGCGYEVGCGHVPSCGHHFRAFRGHGCGCGWSMPRISFPSFGCGTCGDCGKHRWFGWLHHCHRFERGCGFKTSCGCGYEPACGYAGEATHWKEPATVAPTPVNPPRPKPEPTPAKQDDKQA